jgi:hypothetical protein
LLLQVFAKQLKKKKKLFLNFINKLDLSFNGTDNRCEDRQKVGEKRGDIGAIRLVLTPSFRKPQSSPKKKKKKKKRTVKRGDAF